MNKRHKESIIVSVKKKEAVIINKDGFTLLEILAAMSIMAIAMLALATMQFAVVRNNSTGNQFTSAIEIAREQIELLKNENVTMSVLTTSALLSPTPLAGIHADNPIDGVYSCTWTVNDYWFDSDGDGVDETLSTFGRRLSVTVTWIKPGPGGGNRTVTLQSLTMGNVM